MTKREPTPEMIATFREYVTCHDPAFVLRQVLAAAPAVQDAPPPHVPEFIRKRLERACDEAENPKGMSTHAGIAHVMTCDIRRLLAAAVADAPRTAATPGDPANVIKPDEFVLFDHGKVVGPFASVDDLLAALRARDAAPQEDAPLPAISEFNPHADPSLALAEFDAACKAMARFDIQPRGAKRLADAITELGAALAEKDAALREMRHALRVVAIVKRSGNAIHPWSCQVCNWQAWSDHEPERHAPGCLAALGSEKGATE